MSKKIKDRIASFMYANGINTSRNKRNIPTDDEDISQPLKLDLINTGIDFVKNHYFVRVRFLGSSKHYDYHFGQDDYVKWNTELSKIDFKPDCDIFGEEEKVW